MRIPLLVALAGSAGVVVWGYIAARYIADFLPFLIIASFVGLVDLWRRLDGRSPRIRYSLLGAVIVLGVYGVVANVASASTPTNDWTRTQTLHYVQAQKSISDSTGDPIVGNIERGSALPLWAPADKLFIVDDCRALYVSNGMDYSHNSPQQTYEHQGWMAVQYGPRIVYDVSLTLRAPVDRMKGRVPIVAVGPDTIWMAAAGPGAVRFGLDDGSIQSIGPPLDLVPNFSYPIELVVDPYLRWLTMTTFGKTFLTAEWRHGPNQPVSGVQPAPGGFPFTTTVADTAQDVSLCRGLLGESEASSTVASAGGPGGR
jgi:hypothetical protein